MNEGALGDRSEAVKKFGRIILSDVRQTADGVVKSAAKVLKDMMSSGTFLTSHFLVDNMNCSTKIFDRIRFFF